MKKIFIVIAVIYAISMLIYELIYIKQKKLDILANVGIDASKVDYYIKIHEQEAMAAIASYEDKKAAEFYAYIKKRTDTVKWAGAINNIGAVALNLIPYVGPILSVAAITAGKVAADNEMKNINKKAEEGF